MNFYFLEYAYRYIIRYKNKNIFIVTVFTLLVMLLATLFFLVSSVKYELFNRISDNPDIIIKNYKGGIPSTIDNSILEKLLEIDGVSSGRTRVEGDYYFRVKNKTFRVVGIDIFENQDDPLIKKLIEEYDLNESSILISKDVQKIMHQAYYRDYFNFVKPNGNLVKFSIRAIFDVGKRLDLQNLILMSKDRAKEIFGYEKNKVTDIALDIANKNELDFISEKIRFILPNAKVISKNDLKMQYEKLFDYDSGIFLSLFIITIFTFFIMIYDKANGLSSEEKREIGILKALGWQIDDILHVKFYEAALLSLFSFFLGLIFAFVFVFILKAPFVKNIFIHENLLDITTFNLSVHFDFSYILLVFLLSVPIYIAATLIPAWRVATIDADEVMR